MMRSSFLYSSSSPRRLFLSTATTISVSKPAIISDATNLLKKTINVINQSLLDDTHTKDTMTSPPPPNNVSMIPRRKNIEIKLSGPDLSMIKSFANFCIKTGESFEAFLPGPKSLNRHIQKWSILSSPHVHKSAFTQFERRTHAQLLRVFDMDNLDLIKRYVWYLNQHCPPDVCMECMMHEYIPISDIIKPIETSNNTDKSKETFS